MINRAKIVTNHLKVSKGIFFTTIAIVFFALTIKGEGILFGNYTSPLITKEVSASESGQWEIQSFDVRIELTEKDLFLVEERIDTNFFIEKHGIYRDIPYKYSDDSLKGLLFPDKITIKVESVTDQDGNKWKYDTSTYGDYYRIKIGDADKYISGQQTYIIKYQVKQAIGFYPEHDELYWNATGNEWPVEILQSTTRVILPANLNLTEKELKNSIDSFCYTGSYSSTESECTISENLDLTNPNITFEVNSELGENEGISIGVTFPKGTIKELSFLEKYWALIALNSLVCLPIPVSILLFYIWWGKGKDKNGKGTIVPRFQPPNNISPAEAGVLFNNSVDSHDVSAMLIDLAIRGYIKIEELPKKLLSSQDYNFTLTDKKHLELNEQELMLLDGVFGSSFDHGTEVALSSLNNSFYKTHQKIENSLYSSVVEKGLFFRKPWEFNELFLGFGLVMLIAPFMFIGLFIEWGAVGTAIGIIVSGILTIIISRFMPQRTTKGSILLEELLGLKMYIEIAEKDRIETLQSPDSEFILDKSKPDWEIKLFEKLLPYAMVFKVEKKWAEKFKDLYTSPPDWYKGNSSNNFNSFNTIYFVNSLSSASQSIGSSFTSMPKSSGSGSGGGGFSGGGGGGGGGGSW